MKFLIDRGFGFFEVKTPDQFKKIKFGKQRIRGKTRYVLTDNQVFFSEHIRTVFSREPVHESLKRTKKALFYDEIFQNYFSVFDNPKRRKKALFVRNYRKICFFLVFELCSSIKKKIKCISRDKKNIFFLIKKVCFYNGIKKYFNSICYKNQKKNAKAMKYTRQRRNRRCIFTPLMIQSRRVVTCSWSKRKKLNVNGISFSK
jgi:hypothetical protein